ncbi:MAG TPA: LuxR C-terminal-related transcriptional regulator, partial [Roseiflexaceae bacterium]|nr:LuxR C-terminal-related transcriptional regulator [Roseiflexaceae bacterium]
EPDVMRRAARPAASGGGPTRLQDLTPRELEILYLVSEGSTNREIAERLDISYYTVMKHVSNVISKLKVSNRMEAGLIFLRYGGKALISVD